MNQLFPRISIVTPSYNQGQSLEKTILSVLNQNYPNLEYIIMDGVSTDNSFQIIKKYAGYLKHWVSEPDSGQSHAINKGFTHATGDLFAWLNSDDQYMPGALHTVAKAAMSDPSAGVFVGIGQKVDRGGRVLHYERPPSDITVESLYNWMNGCNFMQPSCFFRKAAWEDAGPLDEKVHIALDVDLWLRMAKTGIRFVTINEVLSAALRHESAKTAAFKNLMRVDCAIVVIKHGGEHAVRRTLEDMAQRLSWYEPNFKKVLNNPLFKLLQPVVRLFIRPAVRWRDTLPPWFGKNRSMDNSKK